MKGRKPLPTNLKIIQGNRSRRPLPKNEPKFETPKERIDPREYLGKYANAMDDIAVDVWNIVTPDLHSAGILTKGDYMTAIGMCNALRDYIECRQLITKHGSFFKDEKDGMPNVQRYARRANAAWSEAMSMMAMFGMTPSDRTRIKSTIDNKEKDDNPFVFKGGKK